MLRIVLSPLAATIRSLADLDADGLLRCERSACRPDTPSAPSIKRGSEPAPIRDVRPPPRTGMPRAASTTAGTSATCRGRYRRPPPSAPCATSNIRAVCRCILRLLDRLDLADHQRAGLLDLVRVRAHVAEESMIAAGFRSSARSSSRGFLAMLQVMKPTPDTRGARGVELAREPSLSCRNRRR
jgi:hypothetical protein